MGRDAGRSPSPRRKSCRRVGDDRGALVRARTSARCGDGPARSPHPAGVLGLRAGPAFAATDSLRVTLTGAGGHGSRPEATVDPVVMAAATVMRLQTIVSREIAGTDTAVVTVGASRAGTEGQHHPRAGRAPAQRADLRPHVRSPVLDAITRIVERRPRAGARPAAHRHFEASQPDAAHGSVGRRVPLDVDESDERSNDGRTRPARHFARGSPGNPQPYLNFDGTTREAIEFYKARPAASSRLTFGACAPCEHEGVAPRRPDGVHCSGSQPSPIRRPVSSSRAGAPTWCGCRRPTARLPDRRISSISARA